MNNRLKSLDILKGIAITMVVLVHYNQSYANNINAFKFGQMGCQVFFVLSGFSVTSSFCKIIQNNNNNNRLIVSVKKFYNIL